jgi:hypothetical protein
VLQLTPVCSGEKQFFSAPRSILLGGNGKRLIGLITTWCESLTLTSARCKCEAMMLLLFCFWSGCRVSLSPALTSISRLLQFASHRKIDLLWRAVLSNIEQFLEGNGALPWQMCSLWGWQEPQELQRTSIWVCHTRSLLCGTQETTQGEGRPTLLSVL